MRGPAHTMGVTPTDPGTMCTPSEVIAELREVLQSGTIMSAAYELPPQRQISHDDEEPRVVREWEIRNLVGFILAERDTPRMRYKAIGAVVIVKGKPCVLLLDPAYLHEPFLLEGLWQECERWRKGYFPVVNDQKEEGGIGA